VSDEDQAEPKAPAKKAAKRATPTKATGARKVAGARKTTRVGKATARPSSRAAPKTVSADALVPAGFQFGVATSGFQIEGGFNGPGEPANNWVGWERAGRVEPSGLAVDFWGRYEEHLDRAAALGCDAMRLGVEWARVEPALGQIDDSALAHYATILEACHQRDMEPLVTLHHFTHPAWLGEDFWLSAESPERFAGWVETAVGRLAPHCRAWVTINEINAYMLGSYLLGIFPPGRRMAFAEMATAADHLLAAHIKAYDVIHRLQPDATVTTNNVSISLYELDRILIDVLAARSLGVGRQDVGPWTEERRAEWYGRLVPAGPLERALRRSMQVAWERGSGFSRALDALWASPHGRTLDVVGIDYYDPVIARHARLPGHRTAGGRSWQPAADLWDDRVVPDGIGEYARANALEGLDVWIVENGLCNRVRRGRSFPRLDGWDRVRYLQENLRALVDAVDSGVRIGAYYHWSLTDNYEWGSYEPRFGIHGIDRERGLRILDEDALGFDAAGAYRRLIEGLRSGDGSVLTAEL
jgi:beta-glucosidase/6-phospho-beta-glucosidase/beta-galactosidase